MHSPEGNVGIVKTSLEHHSEAIDAIWSPITSCQPQPFDLRLATSCVSFDGGGGLVPDSYPPLFAAFTDDRDGQISPINIRGLHATQFSGSHIRVGQGQNRRSVTQFVFGLLPN